MTGAPPTAGWRMLTEAGVDAALITDIQTRDRQPLLPADGDAFYAMLAATKDLDSSAPLPQPTTVDAVSLLKNADAKVGQWIRVELETVQITRITVTDPQRQAQLGQDHYFQIDRQEKP